MVTLATLKSLASSDRSLLDMLDVGVNSLDKLLLRVPGLGPATILPPRLSVSLLVQLQTNKLKLVPTRIKPKKGAILDVFCLKMTSLHEDLARCFGSPSTRVSGRSSKEGRGFNHVRFSLVFFTSACQMFVENLVQNLKSSESKKNSLISQIFFMTEDTTCQGLRIIK